MVSLPRKRQSSDPDIVQSSRILDSCLRRNDTLGTGTAAYAGMTRHSGLLPRAGMTPWGPGMLLAQE